MAVVAKSPFPDLVHLPIIWMPNCYLLIASQTYQMELANAVHFEAKYMTY